MQPQVFGRDEPLAELDRFVGEIAERPRILTIAGEAGIGKSTVWQVAVEAAASRGYHVLVSRPANPETALAYSGLADLLAHLERARIDGLPVPQRRALDVALLVSEPTGRTLESRSIFAGLGGVLRSLSSERPVLIAIDDEQWLDKSSLRALDYVSRRLEDAPVGILTTARLAPSSGAPGPRLTDAHVLRLGPLSPAALHRLIDAQIGVSLLRPLTLRIHRASDGNPFFALELARVLVATGMPGPSDPLPVTDDLRGLVAASVGRLPSSVRTRLLAAAAGSRSALTGLGPSGLQAAQRAGVVAITEQGSVRFAHPLFAAAIYEAASTDERRSAHSVLAAEGGDIEEQARHRALACEHADDQVAALLDQAAAKARSRGAPDVAAELEDRSIALTPTHRPEQARRRRLAAAEHHFHAGDLERAKALLLEEAEGQPPCTDILRQLGEVHYRLGDIDEAIRLLRQAIIAADGDTASVAAAELDLSFILFYSFGSFAEARAMAHRALAAAEETSDRTMLAGALAATATTDLLLGHGLNEALLARALELEDADSPSAIERRPSMLAGHAFLHTDQLDRARSVLVSLRGRLLENGEDTDLPDLLAVLARVECVAGNLAEAATLADLGFELARQANSEGLAANAKAIHALVDANAGRVEEARASAALAIDLAAHSGVQIAAFWSATALGLLELSLGNDEAVIVTLAQSIALVEQNGLPEPTRCPFLPDAIEALVRLGDVKRADVLTGLLEERGRALGRRSATVAGARCRALVLAGRGDVSTALERLEQVLSEDPSLPMPLELARTLFVRGQLERRRKQKRAASDSFRRALTLCERMGATIWAERARAELGRVEMTRDRDALSPTEARVAALAASGLTNREIAAAAFMSQKTVEANLSRIYRKLRIRSRAELGIRLAAPEADRSSADPGLR